MAKKASSTIKNNIFTAGVNETPITPNCPALVIQVPKSDRMKAIAALATAIQDLARALNEADTSYTVQNCVINSTGGGNGLLIGNTEPLKDQTWVDLAGMIHGKSF